MFGLVKKGIMYVYPPAVGQMNFGTLLQREDRRHVARRKT